MKNLALENNWKLREFLNIICLFGYAIEIDYVNFEQILSYWSACHIHIFFYSELISFTCLKKGIVAFIKITFKSTIVKDAMNISQSCEATHE